MYVSCCLFLFLFCPLKTTVFSKDFMVDQKTQFCQMFLIHASTKSATYIARKAMCTEAYNELKKEWRKEQLNLQDTLG